jgi:FLVCR family MFS transporter 7
MNIEVGETSFRWVILTLYSLSLGCNAMMWISVSPILSVVSKVISKKTYDVADIWVEMCSLVYMIIYVPIVFPSNYILDKLGLRTGVTKI